MALEERLPEATRSQLARPRHSRECQRLALLGSERCEEQDQRYIAPPIARVRRAAGDREAPALAPSSPPAAVNRDFACKPEQPLELYGSLRRRLTRRELALPEELPVARGEAHSPTRRIDCVE